MLHSVQSYEKSGGGQLETDKSDVTNFEKTYKAQKSSSMKSIKKWEKEFNKANKKKRKVYFALLEFFVVYIFLALSPNI